MSPSALFALPVVCSSSTDADFKAIFEVKYQTPVPELVAEDETEYGLNVLFRYKISRSIGTGAFVELGHQDVLGSRRGVFTIQCNVDNERFGTSVTYRIEREYQNAAGDWIDDSGDGSSRDITVAWPGNCQHTEA